MRTLFILALMFICAEASAQAGNKFGVPSAGASHEQSSVANLPTCNSYSVGVLRVVTDANSPTFGSTLAGGGAVVTLALCNGTNWTAR